MYEVSQVADKYKISRLYNTLQEAIQTQKYDYYIHILAMVRNEAGYTIKNNNSEQGTRKMSNPIVFISHQYRDIDKANRIRDFLMNTIGLDAEKDIFFQGRQSSGVGIGNNIDDDMKNALLNNECYFIALFSEQYFQSIACMKELGGAWVLDRKIVAFVFKNDNESTVQKTVMDNSKDAIGNRLMILVEDQNRDNMVERIIELSKDIEKHFNIPRKLSDTDFYSRCAKLADELLET